MKRILWHWRQPLTRIASVVTLFAVIFGTGAYFVGRTLRAQAADSSCQLGNPDGQIKHAIYLQFDNTHYNRDNPNVASDLEQMPHLLNFLTQNGTLFTNDHTILISHTAG